MSLADRQSAWRIPSKAGLYVYGISAIALGVVGLVWNDFATNWQRVAADIPHRLALARISAAYEIVAGITVLYRRWVRAGVLLLTALYLIFAVVWAVQVVAVPTVYDNWGNLFEELSLVTAGLAAFAWLAPEGSPWRARALGITRLYGICVISFGLDHLIYLSGAASFVPRWIPPGQMFWAITTAICFLLAAVAILSGFLAVVATRLLAVMIMGFEVLVWLPRLFSAPHDHFNWAGNAMALALASAAWVIADVTSEMRKEPKPLTAQTV
ncbi:MAG: hypothetical protein ACRD25_02770 [Terracidiphilus sp.]